MHTKLWPKAPAKEGALDQMSKNFEVYFIRINFLRNETQQFTIEPKNYTAMLLYLFFDSSLSTCLKKIETGKWPSLAFGSCCKLTLFRKRFIALVSLCTISKLA